MKWTYNTSKRSKAALLLGIFFVLILVKNMINSSNINELGDSFSSVYEDRLMAESYIYELSDHLYQKKIMLDNCTSNEHLTNVKEKIGMHNAAIAAILLDYEKTKLTDNESILYTDFKKNLAEINFLESNYINSTMLGTEAFLSRPLLHEQFINASNNLHQLSGIQVSEAKILNDKSRREIAGSALLTQFETAILISIGLLIQVLIFSSDPLRTKIPQNYSLN